MESVRRGAYAKNGDLWRNYLSKEAKDIIGKMLEVDPSKRICASDALKHPFFAREHDHSVTNDRSCIDAQGSSNSGEKEAAAMRGVLIARTSQHLKTRGKGQASSENNGGKDGFIGWLKSFLE